MYFKEKVHPKEVIKWGIFGGIIEGIFCLMIALLWLNREKLLRIGQGWELDAMILIIGLFVLSFIISSTLVFVHPLYSVIKKRYREAVLTILTTVITLIIILFFIVLSYRFLY